MVRWLKLLIHRVQCVWILIPRFRSGKTPETECSLVKLILIYETEERTHPNIANATRAFDSSAFSGITTRSIRNRRFQVNWSSGSLDSALRHGARTRTQSFPGVYFNTGFRSRQIAETVPMVDREKTCKHPKLSPRFRAMRSCPYNFQYQESTADRFREDAYGVNLKDREKTPNIVEYLDGLNASTRRGETWPQRLFVSMEMQKAYRESAMREHIPTLPQVKRSEEEGQNDSAHRNFHDTFRAQKRAARGRFHERIHSHPTEISLIRGRRRTQAHARNHIGISKAVFVRRRTQRERRSRTQAHMRSWETDFVRRKEQQATRSKGKHT
ncbi:hypothetical protein C7974DRAFT_377029 [Boeremia exigua]|uniref:uncharacterized protein n=1 Tax=Boeremia exigua TaxID=749465 RepID=UPI001E8E3F3A|nr:uncharacterized protein C7974DRAFT_377029 [Boeremia exigua]KAH6625526.1 hypothetical protein C7974DRAFT_377029 [Boeremia exigua]